MDIQLTNQPEKTDFTPRRVFVTKSTDGTEYIAEFDDHSTAAVRHTSIAPDGRISTW